MSNFIESPFQPKPVLGLIGRLLLNVAILVAFLATPLFIFRAQATQLLPWFISLLTVGVSLVAFSTVYFQWIRRYGQTWQDMGLRPLERRAWPLIWQIPAVLLCALAAQGSVLSLLPQTPGKASVTHTVISLNGPLLTLVLSVFALTVMTPLWEELVFRGLLYGMFRTRLSFVWAIIASAACFAGVHVNLLVMPYVFVIGLGAAWLANHYRSLWASFALHVVNNSLVAAVVLSALR